MSAYDDAVRMLASRALSVAEVGARLARRGHPAPEIESAVRALRERRYLDDAALAYNVASFLAARRRFGRVRVASALSRRGVPPEAAREAIERVYAEIDEESLAFQAASAAVRSVEGSTRSPRAARERLARSLLRRGFPREVVARVVRTVGTGGAVGDVQTDPHPDAPTDGRTEDDDADFESRVQDHDDDDV